MSMTLWEAVLFVQKEFRNPPFPFSVVKELLQITPAISKGVDNVSIFETWIKKRPADGLDWSKLAHGFFQYEWKLKMLSISQNWPASLVLLYRGFSYYSELSNQNNQFYIVSIILMKCLEKFGKLYSMKSQFFIILAASSYKWKACLKLSS